MISVIFCGFFCRRGIHLDRDFLNQQRALAEADRDAAIATFREKLVAGGYVAKEDASSILLSSSLQMAHLIFGSFTPVSFASVDLCDITGLSVLIHQRRVAACVWNRRTRRAA